MRIILGSKSPRRRELLDQIKVPYEIITSDEDEVYEEGLDAYHKCESIGYHKALNVYKKTEGDRLVIGSDTVVIYKGEIFGKPKDRDDALRMIKSLSGDMHEVCTSYAVIVSENGKETTHKGYIVTKVYVDELSDEEIDDWIDNHNVYDKAGAYAIQEEFGKHINKFEGDYYTIVGFPLNEIYKVLKQYLKK